MTAPAPPPATFWRVEWDQGFGWPECTRRERTSRNFTSLDAAVRQILTLLHQPDHHRLVGVWQGRAEWRPISTDERLALIEEVTSGWSVDARADGEAPDEPG
jgi:hypothetical protein